MKPQAATSSSRLIAVDISDNFYHDFHLQYKRLFGNTVHPHLCKWALLAFEFTQVIQDSLLMKFLWEAV